MVGLGGRVVLEGWLLPTLLFKVKTVVIPPLRARMKLEEERLWVGGVQITVISESPSDTDLTITTNINPQ